jgi:vacuolar-type H+-ATPase subunit F/Vma7
MAVPCYVGDEVTAAGFRLAGIDVLVPRDGHEREALAQARLRAPLVLLCAAVAARIDAAVLAAALAALHPPVAILPDVHGEASVPDPGPRIARALGLDA